MSGAFKQVLGDATLKVSAIALPNAASTTVHSNAIDLGLVGQPILPPGIEYVLNYGALTTVELPDGTTLTITAEAASNTTFSTGNVTTLATQVVTGAGGAGAPAGELRIVLPSNCPEFIRATFVTGAGTGNQSATVATLTLAV